VSTEYYRLAKPITSIRTETRGGHTHLSLWLNHAKSGTLVLRNDELSDFLDLLCGDDRCLLTHYGGKGVGVVVTEGPCTADDREQVVDEYGKLSTALDVRESAGKGA